MWADFAMSRRYPWPPHIQVAGVSSLDEALFCKSVGVDTLGFTLGLPGGMHDGLTEEKAAYIIRRLPEGILPLVITYLRTAMAACRLVSDIGAAAVQFHGGISTEEISLFRELCPSIKTISVVTVIGTESVVKASQFMAPLWNCILLDSLDSATGRTGATGRPHDWTISAEIVKIVQLPVILAGGLNPENVAAAIREVRPRGVDAHTGLEEKDGARSLAKIGAFAQKALEAFRNLSGETTRPERHG